MQSLPEWVIFHVPHDSVEIPVEVKQQFALDETALRREVIKMTDHLTMDLFTLGIPGHQIVRAPVSRLVVDVERFVDDALEPMSARGMGVVYQQTSDGKVLRRSLDIKDRQALIDTWYWPHHRRLEFATQNMLAQFGKAFLIDAHSFPSVPLPYEPDQNIERPEICIGTDEYHTPSDLEAALVQSFERDGFKVKLNTPFAGALVPIQYYRKDKRVSAAMVEVRRDLYIDESSGHRNKHFSVLAQRIRQCIVIALNSSSISA